MNKVNFEKYRFEVMLIVIVVVLLIFWMMINYFENKNKNNNANFAPINSNIVNETAGLSNYNIESFENEEPTGHNTEPIEQKNITRTKQTGESSNAPLINKEDYKLNFEQESAEKIHNKIRALGFGKAVADINDKPLNLKILKTSIAEDKIFQVSSTQKPSTIIFIERGLGFFVKCNSGVLLIEKLLNRKI